jgi:thymidylate kinase
MTGPQRPWVSLEGINGVGKTHLARNVAAILGDGCVLLAELPDAEAGTLPAAVIAALRSGGDLFLRTGTPVTETVLLSALQVHRWESLTAPARAHLILEDRGPYTVAAYQGAIIAAGSAGTSDALTTALRILGLIAQWRPLPTMTALLRDDPGRCLSRFEQRIGRSATRSERQLMARASDLYLQLAATAPDDMTIIDRTGLSEQQATALVLDTCIRATGTILPGGGTAQCPSAV